MAANRLKLYANKTQISIWIGSGSQMKKLTPSCPSLTVGSCTVKPIDSARLVHVTWASNSTSPLLVLHVSTSYDRHVVFGWTLNVESTATLVHAFVTIHVDYCRSLLYRSPKNCYTYKLQRVLNSAARVIREPCPCSPMVKPLGAPCAVERDVRSGRGSIRASARARPPT